MGLTEYIAAGARIWEYFSEWSRVRVGVVRENCGPDDPRNPYIVISAFNRGKRTATLQTVGVMYANGSKLLAKIFWPRDTVKKKRAGNRLRDSGPVLLGDAGFIS